MISTGNELRYPPTVMYACTILCYPELSNYTEQLIKRYLATRRIDILDMWREQQDEDLYTSLVVWIECTVAARTAVTRLSDCLRQERGIRHVRLRSMS